MVRLKDIAKKANVSTATVSYVLNGSGNISEETKKRVMEVIKEFGYRPNTIAKSLKMNKTNTIGVIVEDITVFNAPEIIDGINEYAEQKGWSIILTNMRLYKTVGNDFINVENCKKVAPKAFDELFNKQVDGIIYIGVHTRDMKEIINQISKPIVLTYCYSSENNIYSINYNDEQVAYNATKYLIEKGHSKISIISGLIDSEPSRGRFNGYFKAISEHNLIFNPEYVKTGNWEFDSGYEYAKQLLERSDRPTAILAMNDLMAAGVLAAAKNLWLNVPEDLSVMGIDDREFSRYHSPKLTTMSLPLSEMGRKSMEILSDLINQKQVEHPELLKGRVIERDSVASPKNF
jgi:LacI family transcriptional regulator